MEIQWYPGQMAKAKRLLRENIKLVDAVIEVLDARIPLSSRNPDIRELLAKKPTVGVLTSTDLADPVATTAWLKELRQDYYDVAAVNANSGEGVKRLILQLKELPRRSKQVRPLRLIVVGIPNVGKSSLINRLIGRSATITGDKPGITKHKQWVRLQEGLELLDTPGMLWPKITSKWQAFGLAAAGAVKAEIVDPIQLGVELIRFMQQETPLSVNERYRLEGQDTDARMILAEIGKRRGCLVKGGTVDLDAAARLLVRDFREGRLGRITLEKAGEVRNEKIGIWQEDSGDDLTPLE